MADPKQTSTKAQTKAQIESTMPESGPEAVLNSGGTPETDPLPSEVAYAPEQPDDTLYTLLDNGEYMKQMEDVQYPTGTKFYFRSADGTYYDSDIEIGQDATQEQPIPDAVAPVNHVQTDEFYTLPAVSNVPATSKEEVIAPVPKVSASTSDLTEHKTGKASNTTAGQLDLAIDRFHELQVKNVPAAKHDLLARLRVLELEAEEFVAKKIALIRAAL